MTKYADSGRFDSRRNHGDTPIETRRPLMAISEDLRSVQATLMQGLNLDNAPLLRLVCSNLQSIAEQVESLENLPLSTRDIVGKGERRRNRRCALGAA